MRKRAICCNLGTTLTAWILALLLILPIGCGTNSDPAGTETKSVSQPPVLSQPPVPAARHAPFFQAGFAYSHIGGVYNSNASSVELRKMRAAGGNIVQLLVFAYVYRLDAPGIGLPQERFDQVLRGGISRARAAGLKTMVKLQTWGPGFDDGKYSADIRMTSDADWQAFMADYRAYVLRYARLAADTNADIFCIGTELAQVSRAAVLTKDWRALAEEIRSVYPGPLAYAAHMGEAEEVPFWDSLDYIGVNGYYPVHRLPAALESLERLAARWNRPVIFSEAGFASYSYALTEPWRPGPADASSGAVRLDLQAEGWRTLLAELWRRDFIWGVYVWKWHPNTRWGGPANADHTPQGKPALDVIRSYFEELPARAKQ
jgi:hypothetical protein